MKIKLLSVGQKMPAWIQKGYVEYAKRLPSNCSIELVEISGGHRGKSTSVEKSKQQEALSLLKIIKPKDWVVILDVKGQSWSTEKLSEQLESWQFNAQDVCLIVGGPYGLGSDVISRANQSWSLSKLTFPHPMVRILIVEQIYRAWSILQGHPYHNG
jgi:23S rRNA (pseudouridine1915-N3)-methyltransferase